MIFNKQVHKLGTTRVVRKFAFVPTDIKRVEGNEYNTLTVWLTRYYATQILADFEVSAYVNYNGVVRPVWLTEERYLIKKENSLDHT